MASNIFNAHETTYYNHYSVNPSKDDFSMLLNGDIDEFLRSISHEDMFYSNESQINENRNSVPNQIEEHVQNTSNQSNTSLNIIPNYNNPSDTVEICSHSITQNFDDVLERSYVENHFTSYNHDTCEVTNYEDNLNEDDESILSKRKISNDDTESETIHECTDNESSSQGYLQGIANIFTRNLPMVLVSLLSHTIPGLLTSGGPYDIPLQLLSVIQTNNELYDDCEYHISCPTITLIRHGFQNGYNFLKIFLDSHSNFKAISTDSNVVYRDQIIQFINHYRVRCTRVRGADFNRFFGMPDDALATDYLVDTEKKSEANVLAWRAVEEMARISGQNVVVYLKLFVVNEYDMKCNKVVRNISKVRVSSIRSCRFKRAIK